MNWVALLYESILETEKALCQQPCILSDGSVIGVCRIDKKLSTSLNLDTRSPVMIERLTNGSAPVSEVKHRLQESDVLVSGATKDGANKASACERVLSFIFGWDNVI